MSNVKFVNVGTVCKSKKGRKSIALDNRAISVLGKYLRKYYDLHLNGLSDDDISNMEKGKKLGKLYIQIGDRKDKDPDFVLGSVYIAVED